MIRHYVLSSRKLVEKQSGKLSYLRQFISTENGSDGALDYLNTGIYEIKTDQDQFDIDLPDFDSDKNEEAPDYQLHDTDFFIPKEHSKRVFDAVFGELKNSPDKILYIYLYGFGNNVASEMKKQVLSMTECYYPHHRNSDTPVGKMLFLSWPSQGKAEYQNGEDDDVEKMARMLAVFWTKLYHYVKDPNNELVKGWKPKIAFHAQSMGNKIMMKAIAKLNEWQTLGKFESGFMNGFFHRIVMTGADIPSGSLDNDTAPDHFQVHDLAERVIFFHNKDDFALWISKYIFQSKNRLGRNAIDREKLSPNIEFIGLTRKTAGLVGHMYFTLQPKVVEGLKLALKDYHFNGQPLDHQNGKFLYYDDEKDEIVEERMV